MSKSFPKEKQVLLQGYLNEYCLIERNLSKTTIKNKKYALARLFRFLGNTPLNIENCRKYTVYLYHQGWTPSSIGCELKMIKAFVNYLERYKYIKHSWSKDIALPKEKRRSFNIVSAKVAENIIIAGSEPGEHDHRLHQGSKSEHRAALRFILRTGLRLSELLSLKYSDINFKNSTYSVISKGGNLDILPLPVDMLWEVAKRKQQNRLFKVSPEGMNKTLKRGSDKLNISPHITVHTLRHIFCTTLLKRGVSLQIVSRLMRHSNVGITDKVYSHYLVEDLSEALNKKFPLINLGQKGKY
jgi:integrase/recombinase XerD